MAIITCLTQINFTVYLLLLFVLTPKGFSKTLTCSLINTSLVSMSFALRIPGDGMGRDSVTSTKQVKELDRNNWKPEDRASEGPREFRVIPSSGISRALSQLNIEVRLFVS